MEPRVDARRNPYCADGPLVDTIRGTRHSRAGEDPMNRIQRRMAAAILLIIPAFTGCTAAGMATILDACFSRGTRDEKALRSQEFTAEEDAWERQIKATGSLSR